MAVKVGDKAPQFELPGTNLKMRKLSDYAGSKVVLAFFPGAFTSVCTKEMCVLRDSMANLNKLEAKVVGVSVDSPFSLAEFGKANNLNFELLSDHSRSVSKEYEALHENFAGVPGLTASKRSIFILDKAGVVKYAWVSEDPGKEPDYGEIEKELSKVS